jgi:hypothetical protein
MLSQLQVKKIGMCMDWGQEETQVTQGPGCWLLPLLISSFLSLLSCGFHFTVSAGKGSGLLDPLGLWLDPMYVSMHGCGLLQ